MDHPPRPKDERAVEAQILEGQLLEHISIVPAAVLASGGVGAAVAAAQWSEVGTGRTLLWCGFLAVSLSLRALLGNLYSSSREGRRVRSGRTWRRLFRLTFAVHGTVWGLCAFLLFPAPNDERLPLLALAVATVVVGSFSIASFDLVAVACFSLAALPLLVARLISDWAAVSVSTVAVLAALLLALRAGAQRIRAAQQESLSLRACEAKQAEAIRRSEALLESAGSLASIGGWALEPLSGSLIWSTQTYKIHHLAPGTEITLDFAVGLYPPEAQPAWRTAIDQALLGTSFDIELPLTLANGDRRTVRVFGRPTLVEDRVSGVTGAVQDITDLRRREAEHEQRARTLRFQEVLLSVRDTCVADIEQLYRIITERATLALGADRGSIWFFEEGGAGLACADLFQAQTGAHHAGAVVASEEWGYDIRRIEKGLAVRDIFEHPATEQLSLSHARALALKSLLAVPLRRSTSETLGVLAFTTTGAQREWSAEDQNFATALAAEILLAREERQRQRAETELAEQNSLLEALRQATTDLLARTEVPDVLEATMLRASILLDAPLVEIALKEGDAFVIKAAAPRSSSTNYQPQPREKAPLFFKVFDTQQPLVITDYPSMAEQRPSYEALRSGVIFPIGRGSSFIGVLALGRTEGGRPFSPEEVRRGGQLAEQAAMVVGNVAVYSEALRVAGLRSRQIQESESKFRAVFSQSPVPIALGSLPEGRIVEINDAGVATFGWSREEAVGRTSEDLGIWVQPESRADILERLTRGESVTSKEAEMRRKDGAIFPVLYYATTIIIQGQPYSLATFQDLTSTKHGQSLAERNVELEERVAARTEELRRARLEAEQASQAKSTFLANMSHEIRTPLNAVLGMIDLVSRTRLDADQAEMIQVAHNSATTLLRVVSDVLDISKIEAGHVDLEHEPFSMARLVEQACLLWGRAPDRESVVVETFIDPLWPATVVGDAARVSQILGNLISNAVKFSTNHRTRPEVRVRAIVERHGPGLVHGLFEVADNGIGIEAEARSRIFHSFSQADASITRRFGGTGLGLSIAGNLARLMGGSIECASEPGSGSVFSVRLPFALAPQDRPLVGVLAGDRQMALPPPPSPQSLNSVGSECGPRRGSILVVEDNPVNQILIRKQLVLLGFSVTVAGSGPEGLARFKSSDSWAMIVTDIQMPGMDGYALARAVRDCEREQSRRPVPIVALTANAFAEDLARCRQEGLDDCITKPATLDRIREVFDKWCRPQP